jgi:hypothetical protein
LADAGFATGAGVAGATAVVGCGNSNLPCFDFLFPRNELFSPVNGTGKNGCKTGAQINVYLCSKVEQENYGRGVP